MSPVARSIYRVLLRRLRERKTSITYGALARAVKKHHRDPRFHAALGEVAHVCRHRGLPCLPAIVWRADTRRPSDGYYAVAHPRAHGDGARTAAWEREHARVVKERGRFPGKI